MRLWVIAEKTQQTVVYRKCSALIRKSRNEAALPLIRFYPHLLIYRVGCGVASQLISGVGVVLFLMRLRHCGKGIADFVNAEYHKQRNPAD